MSENEPVVQGPEGESAKPQEVEHRERPNSAAFRAFIASGWAPRPAGLPARLPAAEYAADRRARLAAELPGERLVIPAGVFRVRSNDTDHRFRPHSAFAHLTGLGTDREPDSALVLEPSADGFEAVLYVQPRAERDSEQFYADPRYGELWVGVRPSLEEVAAETGLVCRPLDDLVDAITKDAEAVKVRIVRDADPALDAALDEARGADSLEADAELARVVSELRLVKDAFEVAEMRRAVDVTARGFADIVRALPEAVESVRGERVVETVFESRARREGNGVGYDTIAASGPHACTLHWIRNDGPVNANDLVLVDAGVEVDTLYTADVTRTLPVSGTFSEPQRRVYQAVLDAADAAFAAARPGVKFREVHAAAMRSIAATLASWDLLPSSAEESLTKEGQFHRRWMVHGTSHHLGIDVHDCAQARKEMYLDAELKPGMVFTIEPGLYFGPHDLLAPEELRGIGVRIEDDVLVTEDGVENLSAGLPRDPAGIEAWMASLRS
ncbi:aminopeptidase P family protein [Kineosporia succinea]|uniref:Xaa-Pro aminopeptidase n=1 Tax=Kineosporia succinea TaxID=84632 RepID=A0ABT9NYF8_9ACTN|nr:aminopeptidase P family protein [Kineosporia succinea]MDP9825456.1 Xaa-Pro aminopeptidase [Kineosporia succinea]